MKITRLHAPGAIRLTAISPDVVVSCLCITNLAIRHSVSLAIVAVGVPSFPETLDSWRRVKPSLSPNGGELVQTHPTVQYLAEQVMGVDGPLVATTSNLVVS